MQKLYDILMEQNDAYTGPVNGEMMSSDGNQSPDLSGATPDSDPDEVKSILKTISDSLDRLGELSPDFMQSDTVKKTFTDMMSICQMGMADQGDIERSPEDQEDFNQDQSHGLEGDNTKMFEARELLKSKFRRII